ncbi:MAG: S-adenosylmethionine:tRNA ribosyltransferase-isomerase, partial [Clostridiales bacterium]|nr:S-adenosylmethionine:tRNA ribosyltransferase-isomerase [Clostridiales bacterium]
MQTKDFFYDLPTELIAQHPTERRDGSRMMVLSRTTEEIKSAVFSDIVHLLSPNDCLILNDTRVIPARLYGIKDETHANVEF